MYGCLVFRQDLLLIERMATGSSPMQDGPGIPITPGDGHPSTMAVGIPIRATARYGFPVMSGARDGLPGEARVVTTDGRLSAPALAWKLPMAAVIMRLTTNTLLWVADTWE